MHEEKKKLTSNPVQVRYGGVTTEYRHRKPTSRRLDIPLRVTLSGVGFRPQMPVK